MFPNVQVACAALRSVRQRADLPWNHGRSPSLRPPGVAKQPEPMEGIAMTDVELSAFAEQVADDARRVSGATASPAVLDQYAREAMQGFFKVGQGPGVGEFLGARGRDGGGWRR